MNHYVDSENVRNGFGMDAAAEWGCQIIRCLWCFTLLMKLHDFVAEPVNPEHIFHDAHTVSFCLTADHIATCHMFLCPHQVSTVLVCLWTRDVWKTFGSSDVWRSLATSMESHGEMWWNRAASMESHGEMWWKRSSIHGVPWRQRVEKSGSIHGVPWRQRVETRQLPWSPMVSSVLDTGSDGRSRQLVLECSGLSIK